MNLQGDWDRYVEDYLEESFDGTYSASIDIDREQEGLILSIAFTEESEKPILGRIISELRDEAQIDTPEAKMDYRPEEGTYRLTMREARMR